eukprot:gene14472-biopygen11586
MPEFCRDADIGASLASRWKTWLAEFEMFLTASGITNKKQQRALLLYQAGARVCKGNHTKPLVNTAQPNWRKGKKAVHPLNLTERSDSNSSDSDGYLYALRPKSKSKTPKAFITVHGHKFEVTVDTGASINVLDQSTFHKMKGVKLERTKTKAFAYNTDTPVAFIGKFDALVETKKQFKIATFYATKDHDSGCLLSAESAQDLKLISIHLNKVTTPDKREMPTTDINTTDEKLRDIVNRYGKVFTGIGKFKDHRITLNINTEVIPVAQPQRRIPYHIRGKVATAVEKLQAQGLIEKVPADQPTDWISPIVAVPKPNGTVRLCVDMRVANTGIQIVRYLIPTVEDISLDLNEAKYFSKLDLNEAYHQLELEPESRGITTFSTHVGLYRYTRLNYGTNAAAEIFQHTLQKSLQGIKGVKNLADDIIVFGSTREEHDHALTECLARLAEKELTLSPAKCRFLQKSLNFFGQIFSERGTTPDPKRISTLENTKKPTSAQEVRSFLGMVNYSSKYIQDYATITAPLLQYKPGAENPADYLSRYSENQPIATQEKLTEEYVNFVSRYAVPKAMTIKEIKDETNTDRALQAVRAAIKTNHWDLDLVCPFKSVKDELTINSDNIILRGTRIVVPSALQQRAVDLAHDPHQGLVKTKSLLREKVWFPGIDKITKATVDKCISCQETGKANPPEPLNMTSMPERPWDMVHIDFFGRVPTGEYLLVVIDRYSRFPEFGKWVRSLKEDHQYEPPVLLVYQLGNELRFEDIDPMTCILKDLEMLITNAVTGGHHMKGIWDGEKPVWWPNDIRLCSPNFRAHWGREELSEKEKRRVGLALKEYVSAGENNAIQNPMDKAEAECQMEDKARTDDPMERAEDPMEDPIEDPMEVKRRTENQIEDKEIDLYADEEMMIEDEEHAIENTLPEADKMLTKKKVQYEPKISPLSAMYSKVKDIPQNMVPVVSAGDGNCLFNSLGLLLLGKQAVAPILRLAAILHGIEHIQCYIREYSQMFSTTEELQNFLFVITSNKMFKSIHGRTVETRLRSALQGELLGMTKIGDYAGHFQARLAAGALDINIGMHCQEDAQLFKGLVATCSCQKFNVDKIVHVMLVKTARFGPLNHYVPLLWKGSHKERKSGIHKGGTVFAGKRVFRYPELSEEMTKRSDIYNPAIILLRDIHQLMGNGISSATVDFFIRFLQHNNLIDMSNDVFISTHRIWENIHAATTYDDMLQKIRRTLPRDTLLSKKMLLLPVKAPGQWHWVLLVFNLQDKWFLPTDCAQQGNNIDCGIYMLGNIQFLLNKEYSISNGVVVVKYQKFDAEFLRLEILRKMFELQSATYIGKPFTRIAQG